MLVTKYIQCCRKLGSGVVRLNNLCLKFDIIIVIIFSDLTLLALTNDYILF